MEEDFLVCYTYLHECVELISQISFLVFGHFWQRSYENTKILRNLCLHFARQDPRWARREKNGKKITQLK